MTMAAETLAAARRARLSHDLPRADALYGQCKDHSPEVALEYAGYLYETSRPEMADTILTGLLEGTGASADILFLRGIVRLSSQREAAAMDDFQRALDVAPDHVPAMFQRAQLRFRMGHAQAALADFQRISSLAPGNSEAWANAGIIFQRLGDAPAAVRALENACRLSPANPEIRRNLANAYAASARLDDALSAFSELAARNEDNGALLTDHALCLLRHGDLEAASLKFARALDLDPRDQTALTGLYLCANEAGDAAMAQRLMDPRLVGKTALPPAVDLGNLIEAVLAHPDLAWEPTGRSTLGGQQTTMLDLGPGSPFAPLKPVMETAVNERIRELFLNKALAGHPWLAGCPNRWRIQAWATVLHDGGHQSPHIHPAGWMSGVIYLDPGTGHAPDAGGQLVFGHPQAELGLRPPANPWAHGPQAGQALLFPSFFLHHTVPYSGSSPRISVAFDAIPDPM